jgi:tetratricopeptide (TPR) repeat protein
VGTRVVREIEIPSSVQDLIQARIADLDEEEQEILDVAACCGFTFDPGLVAEAAGTARIPVLRRLAHLERKHRLVRSRGDRFAFDHHQVHEALYDALPASLSREYHAAIGEVLSARHPEPDGATAADLCEHLLKGGQGEKALPILDGALGRLEKSYLNEQAVALADLALASEGLLTGASRAEILLRKAARLGLLGRGEPEEATLGEAVAIADEEGDPDLRSRARLAAGWSHMQRSRSEAARERFGSHLAVACEIGDRHGESIAAGNLGSVFHEQGRFETAREFYDRKLAITREIGDRRGEGTATGDQGLVLLNLGRYEEGREAYRRRLEIAREIGDRHGEGSALMSLGTLHAWLGSTGRAKEQVEASVAIFQEIGARREEGYAVHGLAEVAEATGDAGAAMRFCEEALAIHRQTDHRAGVASTLATLGRLLLEGDRHEDARARLIEALELATDSGQPTVIVLASSLLARLPGTSPDRALASIGEHEPRTGRPTRMAARFHLFHATNDRAHLEEAHRLLYHLREHAPEGCRETMMENVPLHRGIMAAWEGDCV